MTETEFGYPFLIMLTGSTIVLARLIKSLLEPTDFPPLVGYLAIGLVLSLIDSKIAILSEDGRAIFGFLGRVGLITLLFHVGLESRFAHLLQHLKTASIVWLSSLLISGACGYAAAYYILELGFITSLVIGTAFTATSIGISVRVWQNAGVISSPNGVLLLDAALLDDISAVILMALLLAVLPVFESGSLESAGSIAAKTAVFFLAKIAVFGLFGIIFARYCEGRVASFFMHLDSPQNFILAISGIGLLIAALAGLLGLSLAVGAFLAGLIFGYDPEAKEIDAGFSSIFGLFAPFFFISIGLDIDPDTLISAVGLGLVLLVPAVLGKILGAAPIIIMKDVPSALLVGVSMVPRAEIAMVIMHHGLKLGDWVVTREVYSAMVFVCVATSGIAPVVAHKLLTRWQQQRSQGVLSQ